MYIAKYPEVPDLTKYQIEEITNVVFCKEDDIPVCDAVFIFGSSHPATYTNAFELYQNGRVEKIIISGGLSKSKDKHRDWIYGNKTEARLIFEKLKSMGVPEDIMYYEEKSTNSKENILFAKEVFDFSSIKSLYYISKNYAAGRQYRTLKKYIGNEINIVPYSYSVYLEDRVQIDRYNWMENPKSRSLVFGEYLRIVYYGARGDIIKLDKIVEGLEDYIALLLKESIQ